MSIQHTARNGKTYFLHVMAGKRGKAKYHFSTRPDGALVESVPAGFEIYENVHSQVFLRRATPRLITDAELEALKQTAIQHATYTAMLRFVLADQEGRLFLAERFCFRGAVDDWIDIGGPPQELPRVIGKFMKHLGRDSFFELF